MKLYVDDVRTPEDETWVIARNYWDAIHILKNCDVSILSLDHDLGDGPTGYDIIRWLDEGLHMLGILPPKVILCHSANPVGQQAILAGVSAMQTFSATLEQNDDLRAEVELLRAENARLRSIEEMARKLDRNSS